MSHAYGSLRKRPFFFLTLLFIVVFCIAVFARQNDGRQAQRHIDAGIDLIQKGQPIEAETEWREATRLSPRNPFALELLSELYINTEQWGKGAEALQRLLKADPKHPFVYSRLAACALRSGSEVEARSFAEEELKRNPNDEASLTILAFLADMQEDTEGQIGYLKRFLSRQPNDADTLLSLALAYSASGKFSDILPVVDRLIAVKPNLGVAYAIRAGARYETDASSSAAGLSEADLLKALKSDPLSSYARYTLGRVYLRQGQYPKAVFQLELAQKLSPLKMEVPFALATAYSRSGQPDKAAIAQKQFDRLRATATLSSVLQKRCSLNPKDFASHLQLGELMRQNGNDRRAVYYLQKALTLNPQSVEAKKAYDKLVAQIKTQQATPAN